MYSFAEFFAGIGGFRIGLEGAGMICKFSCEIDKNCEKTYFENFKKKFDAYDILEVKKNQIPKVDFYVGGFPCQPFSIAGKQAGLKDERSKPFIKLLSLIKCNLPKGIILENVSNFKNIGNKNVLNSLIKFLQNLNYDVQTPILNSFDFGIPQNRRRVFIIAIQKKYLKSPLFIESRNNKKKKFLKDILIPNDYSIPISKKWETYVDFYTNKISKNNIKFKLTKTRKRLERKDQGVNLKNCVFQIRSSGIRAISINKPFPTFAVSHSGGGAMIPVYSRERRHLSINEIKKLMGFKKKFKFPVSRTDSIKQLSNAVCPDVVKNIGLNILKVI